MALNKEIMMQLYQKNPTHMKIYKEVLAYAATNGEQETHVEDYLNPEKSQKILFSDLASMASAILIYGIYLAYLINFPQIIAPISLQNSTLILFVIVVLIAWRTARFSDQKLLYQQINDIITICPKDSIEKAYRQMKNYENQRSKK